MCFWADDADWVAEVVERTDGPAARATRCEECGRTIWPGEWLNVAVLRQYEECVRCADGDCACPGGDCCACPDPDLGESEECRWCEDCESFLAVIEAVERAEGCAAHESRPGYGDMVEQLQDGGCEFRRRYFDAAPALAPALAASGYLEWLRQRWFARREERR